MADGEDGREVVTASLESMKKPELVAPFCYRPRYVMSSPSPLKEPNFLKPTVQV
jgi:hypothetical protein